MINFSSRRMHNLTWKLNIRWEDYHRSSLLPTRTRAEQISQIFIHSWKIDSRSSSSCCNYRRTTYSITSWSNWFEGRVWFDWWDWRSYAFEISWDYTLWISEYSCIMFTSKWAYNWAVGLECWIWIIWIWSNKLKRERLRIQWYWSKNKKTNIIRIHWIIKYWSNSTRSYSYSWYVMSFSWCLIYIWILGKYCWWCQFNNSCSNLEVGRWFLLQWENDD